jgi:hypothetical protein
MTFVYILTPLQMIDAVWIHREYQGEFFVIEMVQGEGEGNCSAFQATSLLDVHSLNAHAH